MLIASRPGRTVEHVLESDRDLPTSDQTVFTIRHLNHAHRARIQDSLIGQEKHGEIIVVRPGSAALEAVRRGVAGWRGIADEDGQPVEPSFVKLRDGAKILHERSLAILPQDVIDEVGGAIMELNGLGGRTEAEDLEEEDDDDGPPALGGSGSSPPLRRTTPSSPSTTSAGTSSDTGEPAPDAAD